MAKKLSTFKRPVKYNKRLDSILLSIKHSKDVIGDIMALRSQLDAEQIYNLMPKLVSISEDIKEAICGEPIIKDYAEIYNRTVFMHVDMVKEFFWQSSILSLHSAIIKAFNMNRESYYKELLLGSLFEADKILDIIINDTGISIWAIENKIGLYSLMYGSDGVNKYINSIIESNDIDPYLKTIVERVSQRALPAISWKRYDDLIDTIIKEPNDINCKHLSDILSFKLSFYKLLITESLTDILVEDSMLSIIDRYITYTKCVQLINCGKYPVAIIEKVNKSAYYLYCKTKDALLLNLTNYAGLDLSTSETFPVITSAYDSYIRGEYGECKIICEKLMQQSPDISVLYEIYVKSLFRLNLNQTSFMPGTILNKIINMMLGILSKNNESISSYNDLMKHIYVFSSHHYIANVYSFCCKEMRYYTDDEYINIKTFSDLNSLYITPGMLAKKIHNKHISLNSIDKSEYLLFMLGIYTCDINYIDKCNMPQYRKNKYYAKLNVVNGKLDAAIELYDELEHSSDTLTCYDAKISKAKILLKNDEIVKCLHHIVESYFNVPVIVNEMPLKNLLDRIENNFTSVVYQDVTLLILYDLYVKNISSDKLVKMTEAYDEFMYRNNIEVPTDIFKVGDINNEYVIYFLRNVCVPNIIDASGAYATFDDLMTDRLNTCIKLQEIDDTNYNIYANEIEEIMTSRVLAKTSSKIGNGRIYIDTTSIVKYKKTELLELYQNYMATPDEPAEVNKLIQHNIVKDMLLPVNKKDQLLLLIYEVLVTEYLTNRDYGLEGNLSLEIRHGQLEELFRIPQEKLHLVTKEDYDGKYRKIQHWLNVYEIIRQEYTDDISNSLIEFTKDIDNIIEDVKNKWFDVRNNTSYYDYSIGEDDFIKLKELLEGNSNFETFMIELFEVINEITEDNLSIIRDAINNEVPMLFEPAFAKLNSNLAEVKRQFALTELDSSIALGRNAVQSSVDELVGWLEFANKHNSPNFNLSLPLNLSIETFSATYSHKNIKFNIETTDTPLMLGRYLYDFVRLFITIFDNIVRHSWLEDIPPVSIVIIYDNNNCIIVVKNSFSSSRDIVSMRAELTEIEHKLITKSYFDSVNKEGKTGIFKIDKIISTSLVCDHKITTNISDDYTFTFKIDIDCRRLMA